LDLRWNVTHLLYDLRERRDVEAMLQVDLEPVAQDPFVIHYTSGEKPWGVVCSHPFQDRFHHYLRRSGWFERGEYPLWRAGLSMRRGLHTLKRVTRPLRHRIGLRRR
jgi:lipopolysaccharide biosynthesis glycosyltransferase